MMLVLMQKMMMIILVMSLIMMTIIDDDDDDDNDKYIYLIIPESLYLSITLYIQSLIVMDFEDLIFHIFS